MYSLYTVNTYLTWNETSGSTIVLEEKYGCLSAQESGKAKTPPKVGFDAHEVIWTPKRVQRDSKACQRDTHNVVRMKRLSRITHYIGHNLGNPKGVKEQKDVAKHIVKLIHNQYAA